LPPDEGETEQDDEHRWYSVRSCTRQLRFQ
jgi:hypothetical protein